MSNMETRPMVPGENLSRAEFYAALTEWKGDLREDLRGITTRLDAINGRLGRNEMDVAVLKDRAAQDQQDRRDERWRQLLWGGGGGLGVFGVIEAVKTFLSVKR